MNNLKPLGLKILALLFFIAPLWILWNFYTEIIKLMNPSGSVLPMTLGEILGPGLFSFLAIGVVTILVPLIIGISLLLTKKGSLLNLAIFYGIFTLIPSTIYFIFVLLATGAGQGGAYIIKTGLSERTLPIIWSILVLILSFNKNISSLFNKN
ncbi:MAG: hypothetical protein NTV48_01030 [Candidatus Vogelbacteria bacterium]|nr:hypothetical protein [Candidatus Vogelbacteria bacterium]